MSAARNGLADVVRLLLSAGANKEAADKVILIIHYCTMLFFFVYLILTYPNLIQPTNGVINKINLVIVLLHYERQY